MTKLILSALLMAQVLVSCATAPTYKKAGDGDRRHGYSDVRLSSTKYNVRYLGIRSEDNRELLYNFFLRRAAEVTIQNGFKFFAVHDGKFGGEARSVYGVVPAAMNYEVPFYEGTVEFKKGPPAESDFKAEEILATQAKKK